MRKLLVNLIVLVLLLSSFSVCMVNASSSDAEVRGYTISNNWTYINDVTNDYKEVWGETYYEGKMSSWMGFYKYLDETTNDMFILVMCTGTMMPNQESYWDQKRWNNQEMRIEFYPTIVDTSIVNLVSYSPMSSEGTMSWSTSIGTDGSNLSVSAGQSYTSPEISVNPKLLENQNNGIKISHNFINYSSNESLNNVCCNLVTKNNFAVFKIRNYSPSREYSFHIDFYATFYRNGKINSSSVCDSQTKVFTLYEPEHNIPDEHEHNFFKYTSNKNGMTHTAKCSCGKTKIEPCFGSASIGGIARCAKCGQFIK